VLIAANVSKTASNTAALLIRTLSCCCPSRITNARGPTVQLSHLNRLDLRRASEGWHGIWLANGIAHQWLLRAAPDVATFYGTFLPSDAFYELRSHAEWRLPAAPLSLQNGRPLIARGARATGTADISPASFTDYILVAWFVTLDLNLF
jgi:hypothetical protein